jgi:hypothetical protein
MIENIFPHALLFFSRWNTQPFFILRCRRPSPPTKHYTMAITNLPLAPLVTNQLNQPSASALVSNSIEISKNDGVVILNSPEHRLEVSKAGGVITLESTIPNGFKIVDNEAFEGKKIIATKPFNKGDRMYVGHAAMLDLSSVGHGFALKLFLEDGKFLSQHFNNDTHSVDDYAEGSKTGSESKRQVYGWDGFMNHSCDANAYFRELFSVFCRAGSKRYSLTTL